MLAKSLPTLSCGADLTILSLFCLRILPLQAFLSLSPLILRLISVSEKTIHGGFSALAATLGILASGLNRVNVGNCCVAVQMIPA